MWRKLVILFLLPLHYSFADGNEKEILPLSNCIK